MNRISTISLSFLASVYCFAGASTTIDLDSEAGLTIVAPDGYSQAAYSFGAVPAGQGTNGLGATIVLQGGDGFLLYGPSVDTGEGVALIECSVWTSTPDVFLAIVGLNVPIDGSLVANMPVNGADYQGSWHRMEVLYDPKGNSVVPAFQVVATTNVVTIVYLDQIVITPIGMNAEQLKHVTGIPQATPTPSPTLTPEITPTPPEESPPTITIDLPGLPPEAKPLEMVLIPAGTFTMGCPSTERGYIAANEWPPHEVTITDAFYMGKYEVTQAHWEAVVGYNPSTFSGPPNHPVKVVSWDDCQTFIESLNLLEQRTFRLPTEAEWEYACRAGTTTRFSFGDALECSDLFDVYCELMDQYMWWLGNKTYQGNVSDTKEVGLKLPNPWGLFDMHGNVFEWCSDWWQEPTSRGPQIDPQGPATGSNRVIRGGSWNTSARGCRSAYRGGTDPKSPSSFIGFRIVTSGREPPTPTRTPMPPVTPSPTPPVTATPTPIESGPTITVDLPGLAAGAKPLEMVLIQPGTFTMGCPSTERGYFGYEWPPHEVTITDAFYMGKYEVTQAQWEAVMGNNPSHFGGHSNHPVEYVSWNNCQAFIEILNGLGQGRTFRLPTEAEWEYACRAGSTTRFSFGDALECYDTGLSYCELMDQYMWWRGNHTYGGNVDGTKEVGLKLPNPWGLYGMNGNVWEWCSDWWQEPTSRGPQIDPQGPATGSNRVIRGGGWNNDAQFCRSAHRHWDTPDLTGFDLGFRIVASGLESPTPSPSPTPIEGNQ